MEIPERVESPMCYTLYRYGFYEEKGREHWGTGREVEREIIE
jgi:hypothetical protein